MGYIGMCARPQRVGFSAVSVKNRVSTGLADFGHFGHK